MAAPLAIGGLLAGAAGGIVTALGQQEQGQANANMYQYQAGVAQINAQINQQNAAWARDTGDVQAEESGLKTAGQIGETTVIQGASGIDVNTGSAVQTRQSETQIGQFDENVIRANAAKKAYGFEVESAKDVSQAGVYKQAATQSIQAGDVSMIGSLLGTASSVSSKWLQASTSGTFSGGGLLTQG